MADNTPRAWSEREEALLAALEAQPFTQDVEGVESLIYALAHATPERRARAVEVLDRLRLRLPTSGSAEFAKGLRLLDAALESDDLRVQLAVARIIARHPLLSIESALFDSRLIEPRRLLLARLSSPDQPPLIRLGALALLKPDQLSEELTMLMLDAYHRCHPPLPQAIAFDLAEVLLKRERPLGSTPELAFADSELLGVWPTLPAQQRMRLLHELLRRMEQASRAEFAHWFQGIASRWSPSKTFLGPHVVSQQERAMATKLMNMHKLPVPEEQSLRLLASDLPALRGVALDALELWAPPTIADRLILRGRQLSGSERRRVEAILARLSRRIDEHLEFAGALSEVDTASGGELEMVHEVRGALSETEHETEHSAMMLTPSETPLERVDPLTRRWLLLPPPPRKIPLHLSFILRIVGISPLMRITHLAIHLCSAWLLGAALKAYGTPFTLLWGVCLVGLMWTILMVFLAGIFFDMGGFQDMFQRSSIELRRVLQIKRSWFPGDSNVELEDDRGSQWLVAPSVAIPDNADGALLPVMRDPRFDGVRTPLEMRIIGVDDDGKLCLRPDNFTRALPILCIIALILGAMMR